MLHNNPTTIRTIALKPNTRPDAQVGRVSSGSPVAKFSEVKTLVVPLGEGFTSFTLDEGFTSFTLDEGFTSFTLGDIIFSLLPVDSTSGCADVFGLTADIFVVGLMGSVVIFGCKELVATISGFVVMGTSDDEGLTTGGVELATGGSWVEEGTRAGVEVVWV